MSQGDFFIVTATTPARVVNPRSCSFIYSLNLLYSYCSEVAVEVAVAVAVAVAVNGNYAAGTRASGH